MYYKMYPCDQSWIFSIITLQCHMTLQKSFEYANLMLKKHLVLLSMLKTIVLVNIFEETMIKTILFLLKVLKNRFYFWTVV